MINEKLYHKTVDILVQAYFNDTLLHCNCSACAVGNVILASHNLSPVRNGKELNWPFEQLRFYDQTSWYDVVFNYKTPDDFANKLISNTGYSWKELARIEHAFEKSGILLDGDEKMFISLMAVIDVLDEIHENKSTDISKTAKSKFQKQAV